MVPPSVSPATFPGLSSRKWPVATAASSADPGHVADAWFRGRWVSFAGPVCRPFGMAGRTVGTLSQGLLVAECLRSVVGLGVVGHPLCPAKAERRLWVRAREGAAVSTHRAPRRLRAGSALAVIIAKITDCGHVPVF